MGDGAGVEDGVPVIIAFRDDAAGPFRFISFLAIFSLQGYEESTLLLVVAASFRQVTWLIFAM